MQGDGVKKDISKAADFLDKACEHQLAQACLDLARLHRSGEGVDRDVEKAVSLFDRACAGGVGRGMPRGRRPLP